MLKITKANVPAILERIEALIDEKRISKTEFYTKSGVSSSLYSQWNTGLKNPTLKSLAKAADYLGVTLDYLVDGKIEESEQNTETARLREAMLKRPELRILFDAAEDAPTSEILNAAAQIMRYKEQNQ